MGRSQSKGYLFEYVIQDLLKKSGYIKVKTSDVKGRGTSHQIDAYGLLSIPTPFIYPIRLICEVKNYDEDKISLGKIRDFVGVMKDISENYIFRKNGKHERFTDSGCYFSSKGFTSDAQKYAWAQNIFLISHNMIDKSNRLIEIINEFLEDNGIMDLNKVNLIKKFKPFFKNKINDLDISFLVGIINGVYPTIIIGSSKLSEKIKQHLPLDSDSLGATKTSREWNNTDTYFDIYLNEGIMEEIKISIPNFIAKNIINKIDKSSVGDKIFYIDIPIISKTRRFVTIDVALGSDNEEYLRQLREQV